MATHRTPAIGSPVNTPDGPGIMAGVTGHLYAVEYPEGIPAIGVAPGSVLGYAPNDVTPIPAPVRALDPDIDWNVYYRNEQRAKPGATLCAICGRPTSSALVIEYSDETGAFIAPFGSTPDARTAPIGPDCAKRYPPEYTGTPA